MTTKPVPTQTFGTVPVKYDPAWYSTFVAQLTRRLGLLAGPSIVQPQILLQSANGKVWKVTVGNTGTLATEEVVRGTTLPPT